MSNFSKMVDCKKQVVAQRMVKVESVCRELQLEGMKITYRSVFDRSGIPSKTLEREPYRSVISKYKECSLTTTKTDKSIEALKNEIKYLNLIIKQLRKENSELRTMLLEDFI